MTAKRFEIKDPILKKGNVIIDNEKEYTFPVLDSTFNFMFYKALNELHSRNKRLEERIQRERTSFTKTHERWNKEAENKIKELSEENERLKQRVEFFKALAEGVY